LKKVLKGLAVSGSAALSAAALTAYLVAPGRATHAQKAPFQNRSFAHRGLHTPDRSVPENSLAAFRSAADQGYGVELDVHLSADDQVVVFHDDDLRRMCSVPGQIEDFTLAELRCFRLAHTQEQIPLLTEVLAVIDGRTPIILELKRGRRNALLCEKVLQILSGYQGDVCIESFDPFIVFWFRLHAPWILRGQLSCPSRDLVGSVGKGAAFLLGNLLTNAAARPQFVAWSTAKKPLTARLCDRLGAMKVVWTCRDRSREAQNDAVIFEFCRPPVVFK